MAVCSDLAVPTCADRPFCSTTADDVAGAPGKSVLSWAVQAGRTEVAGLLLDQGAGLDKADPHGRTPLMGAARTGHPGCVKLLLVRGADFGVLWTRF